MEGDKLNKETVQTIQAIEKEAQSILKPNQTFGLNPHRFLRVHGPASDCCTRDLFSHSRLSQRQHTIESAVSAKETLLPNEPEIDLPAYQLSQS